MKRERVESTAATEGTKLVVRESEESGEAELTLHLARNGVLFQYPHNNNFIFSNKKRADGILFLQRENDWEVMIVELKKTVKLKEWMKIKEQWHGAWLHALALSGVLEAPFPQPPRFLVAYRKDGIDENAPDPILLKSPEYALAFIEWREGRAALNEIGEVTFEKAPLDETGRGELRIP